MTHSKLKYVMNMASQKFLCKIGGLLIWTLLSRSQVGSFVYWRFQDEILTLERDIRISYVFVVFLSFEINVEVEARLDHYRFLSRSVQVIIF
jgi:hypothetical protein